MTFSTTAAAASDCLDFTRTERAVARIGAALERWAEQRARVREALRRQPHPLAEQVRREREQQRLDYLRFTQLR